MMLTDNRFRQSYSTSRLFLKILDESDASKVLTFLNAGASVFNEYESDKSSDFYTHATQKRLLHAEYHMALNRTGVRFYIFLQNDPSTIIGTISYSFLKLPPFQSIMVGYKLLPDYWHMGYANEALTRSLEIIPSVLNVKRVEAFVLPENRASQTLLSRCGFKLEGTAYQCLEVQGIRRDHLQYGFICK